MKKLASTLLAVTMTASLTGCSSSSTASASASATATSDSVYTYLAPIEVDTSNADGVLKDVLDAGVLVVGTSPDFPPAEFIDEEGNVVGCEMQMAQYIADCLGVELQIETMDFSAVLTSVDTGKVDLGISGFGYKTDRAENFELSHGFSDGEANCHTLLVPADKVDSYSTLEDFSGLVVAAQATSLQQMYAEDEIPDVQMELVSTIDQAILDLSAGKVDAVALSCTVADSYAQNSNGTLARSTVEFDLTPYADYAGNVAAAKKGETSLIEAVNTIVDHVNDEGIYAIWYQEAKAQAGIEDTEE